VSIKNITNLPTIIKALKQQNKHQDEFLSFNLIN